MFEDSFLHFRDAGTLAQQPLPVTTTHPAGQLQNTWTEKHNPLKSTWALLYYILPCFLVENCCYFPCNHFQNSKCPLERQADIGHYFK